MWRLFLGPRSSRFERLRRLYYFQSALALLGSIGSIRYSDRSLLGEIDRYSVYVASIEYLPGRGPVRERSVG
eukprot:911744-Alexandrium_andersonii.AAC.1